MYITNRLRLLSIFTLIFASLVVIPPALAHKAKKEARIFFVDLEDGMVVQNPLKIRFGAEGIRIAPVGVDKHRTGHHHLMIDVPEPISMEEVIPFDDNHLHYMNGETEAVISLSPGEHTLQLILGDEEHEPWADWLISDRITITVTDTKRSVFFIRSSFFACCKQL